MRCQPSRYKRIRSHGAARCTRPCALNNVPRQIKRPHARASCEVERVVLPELGTRGVPQGVARQEGDAHRSAGRRALAPLRLSDGICAECAVGCLGLGFVSALLENAMASDVALKKTV